MDAQTYQQMITEGIKGLPPELLSEVADLVYCCANERKTQRHLLTSKRICCWRRNLLS